MPENQHPSEQHRPTFAQSLSIGLVVADSAAVLTEPFAAISFGKNYFRKNLFFGGAVQCFWILAHPQHEPAIASFGTIWLAAVAFQVVVSHWCHFFGRRQITTYVGIPLASYVLPFGEHFCRRIVTPLLVYGASYLIEDRALAQLIAFSAIGQAVCCCFRYAMQSADDDARSDAMLIMRSR